MERAKWRRRRRLREQRDHRRDVRAQLQHARRRAAVALHRRLAGHPDRDGQGARQARRAALARPPDPPDQEGRARRLQAHDRQGQARDRRRPADAGRAHRLLAQAAAGSRRAHPAPPAGQPAQGGRGLRQAVLARQGAHRPGAVHRHVHLGDLRRLAGGRLARRGLRLHRRRQGARVQEALRGRAARDRARRVRQVLRDQRGRQRPRLLPDQPGRTRSGRAAARSASTPPA